jgi:microcystin-dependent protein
MSAPILPADLLAVIPSTTMDKCEAFVKGLITFPVRVYQLIAWMFTSGGIPSDEFVASMALIKPGDYIFSAAPLDETGRLLCDGRAVNRTAYSALYTKIGVVYGTGDGVTTFNLPDHRSRFPIGVSGTYVLGSTGGAVDHVLTVNQTPAHVHSVDLQPLNASSDAGSGGVATGNIDVEGVIPAFDTSSIGGNEAHPNMPPYLGVFIYVKT